MSPRVFDYTGNRSEYLLALSTLADAWWDGQKKPDGCPATVYAHNGGCWPEWYGEGDLWVMLALPATRYTLSRRN